MPTAPPPVGQVSVTVSTLAGSGLAGSLDGEALEARFNAPVGLAVDASGTIFVVDDQANNVRRIRAGAVSTLAGGADIGYVDAQGSAARFNRPRGLALDPQGNVYVTDTQNFAVRKITPDGAVTTLAGGTIGQADGFGSAARFDGCTSIVDGGDGNLYLTDLFNEAIRRVSYQGQVSTVIAKEIGKNSVLHNPAGLGIGPAGSFYVTQRQDHTIRVLGADLKSTKLAGSGSPPFADGTGTSAGFDHPMRLVVDADGAMIISDSWNHRIRMVTPQGVVTTLAGSGPVGKDSGGYADGSGNVARFSRPTGLAIGADGTIYVADAGNHRIRAIRR